MNTARVITVVKHVMLSCNYRYDEYSTCNYGCKTCYAFIFLPDIMDIVPVITAVKHVMLSYF